MAANHCFIVFFDCLKTVRVRLHIIGTLSAVMFGRDLKECESGLIFARLGGRNKWHPPTCDSGVWASIVWFRVESLCRGVGAGGLISSYLTSQLYQLGLWLGSESDIGWWSIGYPVKLGGLLKPRFNVHAAPVADLQWGVLTPGVGQQRTVLCLLRLDQEEWCAEVKLLKIVCQTSESVRCFRGRSPKTFSIGFSAGLSPILVKISVNCLNWWELRWRNCHQIWWHFGWRFCHLLFHPIWWFFWGTAWNGEN